MGIEISARSQEAVMGRMLADEGLFPARGIFYFLREWKWDDRQGSI